MGIKHLALGYLAQRSNLSESGCLEWTLAVNSSGYGSVHKVKCAESYSVSMAHQLAFVLNFGDYDRSLVIAHKCHNRRCINPAHLQAITQSANLQERKSLGTYTHGEQHGNHRLTEANVLDIRSNIVNGVSNRALADKYKVSDATISEIKSRRKWRHI